MVGDVIKLQNGDTLPADCVVLSTDDPLGQCYISTSNLDGERNLKTKLAPSCSQGKFIEDFTLDYIGPDKNIYNYQGLLKYGSS